MQNCPLANAASARSRIIASILFVLLRLENSNIWQVPVELSIIQTIANNKAVRALKSNESKLDLQGGQGSVGDFSALNLLPEKKTI